MVEGKNARQHGGEGQTSCLEALYAKAASSGVELNSTTNNISTQLTCLDWLSCVVMFASVYYAPSFCAATPLLLLTWLGLPTEMSRVTNLPARSQTERLSVDSMWSLRGETSLSVLARCATFLPPFIFLPTPLVLVHSSSPLPSDFTRCFDFLRSFRPLSKSMKYMTGENHC